MPTIEINALDTLFFRDGKPFSMGEETWADGIFPPPPSVIYGAIRTAYFAEHIEELSQANEIDDPTRNLNITGLYYQIGGINYFPLPLDIVRNKDANKQNKLPKTVSLNLTPESSDHRISHIFTQTLQCSSNNIEGISSGLLPRSTFNKYLNAELTGGYTSYFDINEFVITEPKVGIGRNNLTGTSEEGMLYRVGLRRMENADNRKLSLIVNYEGLSLNASLIRLGGEGKTAECIPTKANIDFSKPKIEADVFKLYLLTPAIFEKGWLPKFLDTGVFEITENAKITVELKSSVIGKPIYIGGFDMKPKPNSEKTTEKRTPRPKPMRRAVPAGSVYYIQIENPEQREDFIEAVHQQSISEFNTKQEGFGIALIAKL